ncbi:hypothetical protein FHW36_103215 [Chitinophaga polysaccharea]|uniref:Uncharacterized protein n=1 Tax=Chitinophaga polysaccharea TaxID=1293035 RepID=A0A561PTG5_9BACT|nr:hypothetical protein [Chitinophaga polysaccharea]TWF41411.1 hypothetical protein FHW36_103215 [Chitinophaga polysaccharea]
MAKKRNSSGFYQSLKDRAAWRKVGEITAYEEHLPAGFFDVVGRRAASNAINENRAMKISITSVKDGWVVREMPDGSHQQISQILVKPNNQYKERKLVKGAVIHVGKKG